MFIPETIKPKIEIQIPKKICCILYIHTAAQTPINRDK